MSSSDKFDPLGWDIEPFAIIGNFKMHFLRVEGKTNLDLRRFGMPDDICQGLLENAEQRQADFLRQDLAIMRQRKMNVEIGVFFDDIIRMRANGILQSKVKERG